MATGTATSGGYRLTAARRFFVVALGLVVIATGMLMAPSAVWAADPWMREVRFPAVIEEGDPVVRWQQGGGPAGQTGTDDECQTPGREWQYATADTTPSQWRLNGTNVAGGWLGTEVAGIGCSVGPTGGSAMVHRMTVEQGDWGSFNTLTPLGSVSGTLVEWSATAQFGLNDCGTNPQETRILRIQQWSSTFGSGALLNDTVVYNAAAVRCTLHGFNVEIALDPDARTIGLTCSSIDGCYIADSTVTVTTDVAIQQGNCEGQAGAGTDSGLVIPAAGLSYTSGHTMWGDVHMPDIEACRFERDGLYRYWPPEGIDAGDTHRVGVEVSTTGGVECLVVFQWNGDGPTVEILNFTYAGEPGGAAGPGAKQVNTNAPEGADYITLYFSADCQLHGLLLANVEGDPVIDDGSDGTGGPGPDLGGSAWDDCQPGTDFLAVGEWVAYAACLIAGLPIAIATLIAGVLHDLFVPTRVGARWQAFLDTAGTKVPFGWFVQVSEQIDAGLSAGATSLGSMVLSIGSASVDVGDGLDEALTAVAPYRGVILAGIALWVVLGSMRWIMAAVGVSPSRGGDGE